MTYYLKKITLFVFLLPLWFVYGYTNPNSNIANEKEPGVVEINATNNPLTPTFTGCPPPDILVSYTPGVCEAVVTWTPPTASADAVSVTSNYSPGDLFLPGTTAVVYRAENSSGQIAICSFNVIVEDNEFPVFDTFPTSVTLNADPNTCTATHTWVEPSVSDNCPAGEGESPVLQDFEGDMQCYEWYQGSVTNGGEINGTQNFEATSLSSSNVFASSFTTPLFYFTGDGEISFSHKVSSMGNSPSITIDILDENDNVVINNFFTHFYTSNSVEDTYLPLTFSGIRKIRFRFKSTRVINNSQRAQLDNLLIPGTLVTNINDPSCGIAELIVTRRDGTDKNSGDEFEVGMTTITYEVEDSAGNRTLRSFQINVVNDVPPPTGETLYMYCWGDTPPQLTINLGPGQTANWYDSDGNLVQSGGTTYNPPSSLEPIRQFLVESVNAAGCSSASRLEITLYQIPLPNPPSVNTPVEYCQGDVATPLTAVADADHSILWYTAPTGGSGSATAPTPNTLAAGTTSYYVSQTDDNTGCESERAEIEVIVYAIPNSPTLAPNPAYYCIGDTAQQLDDYIVSGQNPTWYDAATGGNVVSGTTVPSTTVAGTTSYWVTQTISTANCESSRARLDIIVNTPPTIDTQPADQAICEDDTISFTISASNADNYQWQYFNGSSWVDITDVAPYSNATTSTLTITNASASLNGLQYRAIASGPSATCPDAISNPAVLTVNPAPSNPVSGGDISECAQSPIQTLTATAVPPAGSSLVWYDAPSGGNIVASPTLNAVGSITYYAESSDNGTGCTSVSRTPVTLTIEAIPSAPISGGDVTECEQNPIQTLTANATAPAGSTIVWYDAASGGNVVASPELSTVGTVTYYAESVSSGNGCTSTTRTPVALTIQPVPSAPLSGGDVTECAQNPIQTLTATATSPAGSSVVWFDAPSGGNVVGSPTLSSVGTITYYAESEDDTANCTSTNRTAVTLTIDAIPAAPTTGGDQVECEQNPVQTMTATASAPAGSLLIWYDAPTGGNTVASPELNTVGTITYYAESRTTSSGCVSDSRTPVTLTMNARPTISVTPNSQSCAADLTTYSVSVDVNGGLVTATEGTVTDNGGNNWTISGIGSGNNVTVTVTDGNTCSESITINAPNCACPTVDAPISGGNQTECEQNPLQTLTATATPPAGSSVVWYDAAMGGNIVPSPDLNSVSSVTYYAESVDNINGCTSTTRTSVTLTINAAPVAPTSDGDIVECAQNPVQTLTATATPPMGSNVVWYDAVSGGNIVSSPTLNTIGTITYFAESENTSTSCRSINRTPVTLTIEAAPSAPTSSGDITECEQDPVQTLTANATAPAGADVVWYDAATGGNVVVSPTLNSVGTITYYAESEDSTSGCVSHSRVPVTLTIQDTPEISIASGPSCSADLTTYSVGINVSEGVVTSSEGTVVDNGGNNWTISGVTSGNDITVTVTSSNTCDSTMTINAPNCSCPVVDAPVSGGDQLECEQNLTQTLTATATPPSDAVVIWYDMPSGGNVVASPILDSVGTITYYAESRQNVTNCTSSTRTPVTLTIEAAPSAPPSGGDITECEQDPVQTLTANATAPAGADVVWYDAATGGNVVVSPTLNSVGTITYYAESVNNSSSCSSLNRTSVTLTINPSPTEPISGGDIIECEQNPIQTLTASASTLPGMSIVWFDAASGGNEISNPELSSVGTITYYAESRDNTSLCASLNRTPVTLTIQPLPNVIANASVTSINAGEPVTLNGSGASTYVWDNGVTDGDTVYPLVTTTYTVTGTDGNSCENTDSVTVIVQSTSDLSLEKTVNTTNPNVGDTVIFTLTVSNDGPNDDTGGSIVTDILPLGYTYISDNGDVSKGNYDSGTGEWVLPVIPNGDAIALEISAVVNEPTGVTNEYLNVAEVTSAVNYDSDSNPANDDGDQSEDDESSVMITPQMADLEVVNTFSQPSGNPGDNITVTIDIINNGPSTATNVSLVNNIPEGFNLVNINDGGTNSGDVITWSNITIPNGTTTTLSFDVTVNIPNGSTNEYLNTVEVLQVDQFDPDSTPGNDDGDQSEDDEDNAELVLIPADLSLIKSLESNSNPNPNSGDTITFELIVQNEGPGIATNVTVEDFLPIGYSLESVNNGGTTNGNTITWNISTLALGSEILSYTVRINAPSNTPNEYRNIAQITASDQFDPDSSPNNDDGDQSEDDEAYYDINPPSVDIEINKTVDKDQTFFGDTIIFTVTASNNSAYDATNIGIEDILPDGYQLESVSTDNGTYNDQTSTWEITNIPMDSMASLQMTVTVIEGDIYTNIAELIYVDQVDLNLSNDRAEVTPVVNQSKCLTVFNEFSPNNDGANDFFYIECIEQYPNNTLTVYNRWGNEVFKMYNYDNTWDGTSMNKATINQSEKLPVGTYYYTLEPGDNETPVKTGWLYISYQ